MSKQPCGFCMKTRERLKAWAETAMRVVAGNSAPTPPPPRANPTSLFSKPDTGACAGPRECHAKREAARDNPALRGSLCDGCRPLPPAARRT